MKVMFIFLSLLVWASAVPARGEELRSSTLSLIKKTELICEIVNAVTTVDCWYWGSHASTWNGYSNYIVTLLRVRPFTTSTVFCTAK